MSKQPWCTSCDLPREPRLLIRIRNWALYWLFMAWPVRPHSWSDRVWWWLVPFAGAHAHSCNCLSTPIQDPIHDKE